jgi:hypothetical protein
MPDDDKTKRASEIDAAIKAHDAKKRGDGEIDLATERASGGNGGEHLDKLLSALDVMGERLDDAFKRLDAYDDARKRTDAAKKKRDDAKRDDETQEEYEARCHAQGISPGAAREPVADSNPENRALFADAQTQAEQAYLAWGHSAPGPLYMERLSSYKARVTRPLLRHSKVYSKTDLDRVRDPAAFDEICRVVYQDSIAASTAPDSVPRGQLRMVQKKLASGHTVNEFIGEPNAWLDRFAGNRKFVTAINPKARFES